MEIASLIKSQAKRNQIPAKKNDEALRTSFKDISIVTFPIIYLIISQGTR